MQFIENIDFSILFWIQENLRCAFLDVVLPFLTTLCNNGEIWIACGIALICFKKYRRYGIILLVALLLGSLIGNEIIKPLVARARPCNSVDVLPDMLVSVPKSFSFPSGHTASSAVGATVITMANKKFGFAAIPVAVLIAFSRLYVFVHFPTDVLCGAILGVAIGVLCVVFGNKLFDRYSLFSPTAKKNEN